MKPNQIRPETMEGFRDAQAEIKALLSCPVCYAIDYRKATEPTVGYGLGWRLAMLDVIYGPTKHSCGLEEVGDEKS